MLNKRKCRKLAHRNGFTHYWQYKKYVKETCKYWKRLGNTRYRIYNWKPTNFESFVSDVKTEIYFVRDLYKISTESDND